MSKDRDLIKAAMKDPAPLTSFTIGEKSAVAIAEREKVRKADLAGLKGAIETARAAGTPRFDLEQRLLELEQLEITQQALTQPIPLAITGDLSREVK